MNTVFVDATFNDEAMRQRLYDGDLLLYSPRPSTRALCEYAEQMIVEAFKGLDPKTAQYHMPVEDYVAIVGPLKPKFIHDPQTKVLIRDMLEDFGLSMEKTYLDVPRLRMVTSDAYLTTGVGFAHHAHRDTWFSAPMQQLNWWLPIYDITPENTIAFHPYYWNHAVKNGSDRFNYYEWNVQRKTAAQHVKSDTRFQPKAEEELTHLEPEIRTVVEAGGVVLFAGAYLHSTIPNTSGVTRYSIDFRTVNFDDVVNQRSAPNLDSFPKGTALRDFMRGTDFERMPEDVVRIYEPEGPGEGVLIFDPTAK
jgi:hypothetical protein